MVGRCISWWNSPFLGDMLVFHGVICLCFISKSRDKTTVFFQAKLKNFFRICWNLQPRNLRFYRGCPTTTHSVTWPEKYRQGSCWFQPGSQPLKNDGSFLDDRSLLSRYIRGHQIKPIWGESSNTNRWSFSGISLTKTALFGLVSYNDPGKHPGKCLTFDMFVGIPNTSKYLPWEVGRMFGRYTRCTP